MRSEQISVQFLTLYPPEAAGGAAPAEAAADDDWDTAVDEELVAKYAESYPAVKQICDVKTSHPDNIAARNFSLKYFDSLDDELKPAFIAVVNSGAENADSKEIEIEIFSIGAVALNYQCSFE